MQKKDLILIDRYWNIFQNHPQRYEKLDSYQNEFFVLLCSVRLIWILLLRLPVGRGGVINSPRFWFFFPCRKSAHRSWVTPLCIVWATTLNSISSGICHQNTQFNMYTTTSKQQEGCTFEDSHPKCFITTNSTAKLSRGAVNAVMYMFWERHIQRSIRIQFVIILILFDTTDYRCYMVIVRYRSVCVQRK